MTLWELAKEWRAVAPILGLGSSGAQGYLECAQELEQWARQEANDLLAIYKRVEANRDFGAQQNILYEIRDRLAHLGVPEGK